ncbi:MAG: amino acid adenylation domain-containing protein, partial [bacterium]|nr:amino acid adenylation domain-containing protein [bacterium]
LGGHSLIATLLAAKIHKEFHVKIPIKTIFNLSTIRGMAEFIKTAAADKFSSVKPVEKKEYYPTSPAQKRLHFLYLLEPKSTAYNLFREIPLAEDFKKERLEEAFRKLIARHESLRTSFEIIGEVSVQKIHDHVEFKIQHHEIDTGDKKVLPGGEGGEGAKNARKFIRPFDLTRAPLLRVGLMRKAPSEYVLILNMHHIITDAESLDILTREFMALYSQEELEPPPFQYKDYSEWLNSRKQTDMVRTQEAFWVRSFAGELPVLTLPTDYPRPEMQRFEGALVEFRLKKETFGKPGESSKKTGSTLFMRILAIFQILLSKLGGQEDIIVGIPMAGRRHADLHHIVGMFVNTLPMRNYPSADKSAARFLEEVKETALAAFENQEFQFEDLVEHISVRRDTSRNPIFGVIFNLLSITEDDNADQELLIDTDSSFTHIETTSKFDMSLKAIEKGETLVFYIVYNTCLFKQDTIDRIIGYFKRIALHVADNPEDRIGGIEIIPPEVKENILSRFNEDLNETYKIPTIQNKLNKSFAKYAEKTAVEIDKEKITYRELDRRSTHIARLLLGKSIKKGSSVGIYMEDKVTLINAIIGILKTACVFVPLDPTHPGKRIETMIKLCGTHYIITDKYNKSRLSGLGIESEFDTIEVGEIDNTVPDSMDEAIFANPYDIEDAVYTYFTSGTTGTPNAIVGKNKSIVQFIQWEIDTFNIDATFRVSQLAAMGFDAFLRDLLVPLFTGGTLCIPGDKNTITDTDSFIRWINRSRLNLIHCVPGIFRVFNSPRLEEKDFSTLKFVLLAGEPLKPPELENWYETFGERIQLVNFYGSTETTMIRAIYFIRPNDAKQDKISIGQPMRGTRLIILDKEMKPCDRGIVGELYVRTPYMTFGYRNNPSLNEKRFVPNPFGNNPGDLIYKTGDLGKENTEGLFYYIGRIDHQVKVRGVRIELSEIEVWLLKYKGIKETVVLAKEDSEGEQFLCAYIIADPKPIVSELRDHLSQNLPLHMIPSYFITMEKFPLTAHGKTDIKALPTPSPKIMGDYDAPGNDIEEKLVEIWSGILGINKTEIGVNSDFFQLGGHSLKAMEMAAGLHKAFNVKVPLQKLFRLSTIRRLAGFIKTAAEDTFRAIMTVEKKEYYPVSSAQKRLYFLHLLEPGSTAYNMPRQLPLPADIKKEKLEKIFRQLIARHESLRTSFMVINESPVQKIHDHVEFKIWNFEVEVVKRVEEKAAKPGDFYRSFDLTRPPLLRISLLRESPSRSVLLLDMHHIISDAISQNILTRDFTTLYSGRELEPLELQYKDFSGWSNRRKKTESIKSQE